MKKSLNNEKDKRWRTKGHPHGLKKYHPTVCKSCGGIGKLENGNECPLCYGVGTYDDFQETD